MKYKSSCKRQIICLSFNKLVVSVQTCRSFSVYRKGSRRLPVEGQSCLHFQYSIPWDRYADVWQWTHNERRSSLPGSNSSCQATSKRKSIRYLMDCEHFIHHLNHQQPQLSDSHNYQTHTTTFRAVIKNQGRQMQKIFTMLPPFMTYGVHVSGLSPYSSMYLVIQS